MINLLKEIKNNPEPLVVLGVLKTIAEKIMIKSQKNDMINGKEKK